MMKLSSHTKQTLATHKPVLSVGEMFMHFLSMNKSYSHYSYKQNKHFIIIKMLAKLFMIHEFVRLRKLHYKVNCLSWNITYICM